MRRAAQFNHYVTASPLVCGVDLVYAATNGGMGTKSKWLPKQNAGQACRWGFKPFICERRLREYKSTLIDKGLNCFISVKLLILETIVSQRPWSDAKLLVTKLIYEKCGDDVFPPCLSKLFDSLILSIFTYGIQVWGAAFYHKDRERFNRFFKRAARFGYTKRNI